MSECSICGKPAEERYRPFCSKRCADVDLSRWLGGKYVIQGDEDPDPDDLMEHFQSQESTRH